MANWAAVSRVTAELPGVEESLTKQDLRQWRIKDKLLAWERPLRKADFAALGAAAPKGDILGVFVEDLDTKELLIAHRAEIYFTTPHFDGYACVLVRLGDITVGELRQLLHDAWRARAPKRLISPAKGKPARKATKRKAGR